MANEVWHLGHEANAVAWYGTPNYITTAGYFRSPQSRCAMRVDSANKVLITLPEVKGAGEEGWWFSGLWRFRTESPANVLMNFMNGATSSLKADIQNGLGPVRLNLYASGNATPAQDTIKSCVSNQYEDSVLFRFTAHVYTSQGAAKADIYVNDLLEFSLLVGTSGHQGVSHIYLSGGTYYSNYYNYWSEICLANFDLRGKEVATLPPIANGIYTETAGGYADIDEYTPDAAGVIWGADGQRYSYKTAALGLANRRLVALGYAGKASASDGRHLSTFVRVDGVDYPLGTLVSGGVPQIGQTIALVNPATGAAWPVAALPDLEWGLQLDLDS